MRVLVRNFQTLKTLRCTKILFCGRGLKCFSPLRGHNSKTTRYLLSYLFRLTTLKEATKAPAVDVFRLNTLRGTMHTRLFNL